MNFMTNHGYPSTLSEDDLISMAQRGSRRSLDRLVMAQMPTIERLARTFADMAPRGIDVDDLTQQGVLALLRSIRNYRPELGRTLANFSVKPIHGAMADHVRRTLAPVSLPRQMATAVIHRDHDESSDGAAAAFPAIGLAPVSVVSFGMAWRSRADAGERRPDDADCANGSSRDIEAEFGTMAAAPMDARAIDDVDSPNAVLSAGPVRPRTDEVSNGSVSGESETDGSAPIHDDAPGRAVDDAVPGGRGEDASDGIDAMNMALDSGWRDPIARLEAAAGVSLPIADPEQLAIADDMSRARRECIEQALAGLDRRAALVLRARHLRQPILPLAVLARHLRVTPQRVHQIEREAIDRLGRRLRAMRVAQAF